MRLSANINYDSSQMMNENMNKKVGREEGRERWRCLIYKSTFVDP
jgi:hypothetical protein